MFQNIVNMMKRLFFSHIQGTISYECSDSKIWLVDSLIKINCAKRNYKGHANPEENPFYSKK